MADRQPFSLINISNFKYRLNKDKTMSEEEKLENKDKALHIGSVERFTIEDAKEMVKAWESLPEGDYNSETISDWLMDDMKPVIDKFRAKINSL